ncbi:MAG TPA: hemolysin III family protein [Spirochaetota bacterium]|nr:hemolysin III family protein [Spirochaetota bacterium]
MTDTPEKTHKPGKRMQTIGEEIANSITHGIGLAGSLVALAFFIGHLAAGASAREVVSLVMYGLALVFMYQASTLYHAFTGKRIKAIFHRLDHIAIYWLIAGTYAPFSLLFLPDHVGIPLFVAVTSMAVLGTVFKIFFMGKLRILSVVIYLAMGWAVLFALGPMLEDFPRGLLVWLGIGGLFYTLGVVFYAWRGLPYHHPIWHLFVLGGSAAHLIGIVRYIR